MKLTLVGHGTRGDVQPYVCLGFELKKRGHEITVAVPENMRAFVEKAGLRAAPLPVNVQEVLGHPTAQKMLADGRLIAFMRWLDEEDRRNRGPMLEAFREATAGADAIVAHPLCEDVFAALGAAQKIPVVSLYFYPVAPSAEFPALFLTAKNLGPLNRLTHRLFLSLIWRSARPGVRELREKLSLPMANGPYLQQTLRRQLPALFAYSPELQRRPKDWPEHLVSCSSLVPPEELKELLGERGLAPDLEEWLNAGDAPLYIGFGSMPVLHPEQLLALTEGVLERLGRRAVIGAGWSHIRVPAGGRLRLVGAIDHAALFRRCSGAVHHGGAGTTYASLRAGLPTLICSVFADQPYWGSRVEQLGVGATFPFQKLSEERLLKGLRHLEDEGVKRRAAALGEKLRAEDGLTAVADALERVLPGALAPL